MPKKRAYAPPQPVVNPETTNPNPETPNPKLETPNPTPSASLRLCAS